MNSHIKAPASQTRIKSILSVGAQARFVVTPSGKQVRYSMSSNRSLPRNVHFYDATKLDDALGGLVQNGSATEGNFLDMLGMVLVTEAQLRVEHRTSGHIVLRTDDRLEVGLYDIHCDGTYLRGAQVHRLT